MEMYLLKQNQRIMIIWLNLSSYIFHIRAKQFSGWRDSSVVQATYCSYFCERIQYCFLISRIFCTHLLTCTHTKAHTQTYISFLGKQLSYSIVFSPWSSRLKIKYRGGELQIKIYNELMIRSHVWAINITSIMV